MSASSRNVETQRRLQDALFTDRKPSLVTPLGGTRPVYALAGSAVGFRVGDSSEGALRERERRCVIIQYLICVPSPIIVVPEICLYLHSLSLSPP